MTALAGRSPVRLASPMTAAVLGILVLVLAAAVVAPIRSVAREGGAATIMPVTWRRRSPEWQLQRG